MLAKKTSRWLDERDELLLVVHNHSYFCLKPLLEPLGFQILDLNASFHASPSVGGLHRRVRVSPRRSDLRLRDLALRSHFTATRPSGKLKSRMGSRVRFAYVFLFNFLKPEAP